MKLALPILNPRHGNLLLKAGYVLDERIVSKLKEIEVREFWIDMPGSELIKQFVSPVVMETQGRIISELAEVFESAQERSPVRMNFGQYRRLLRGLIEELATDSSAAAYIAEMGGSAGSELRHSAEVCFISVLLGLKLEEYLVAQRRRLPAFEAKNIISLALGAMVHDLGYLRLPLEVRQRYLQDRNENDAEWRAHVALGHQAVSGSIRPAAAGVVHQHHQHYDGSGFPTVLDDSGHPRGLVGEEIHVFARIVCVANHFDRLHYGGDGTIRPRVRVLKRMMSEPLRRRFDPVVLAALPKVVPAFPPGSRVKLSNGERGIVIDWHLEDPCRPVVRNDMGITRDLRDYLHLCVVEHDGYDVRDDNFTLAQPGDKNKAAA
jgi:HD-GYP domain-containing protein (c-di-GMP phosphodiesterase class II)